MNTKLVEKILRCLFVFVFVVGTASMPGRGAMAQEPAQVSDNDVLYTTDADFDQGQRVALIDAHLIALPRTRQSS